MNWNAIDVGLAAFGATCLTIGTIGVTREHRKAAAHRGDTRPGDSAGRATGAPGTGVNTGTIYSGFATFGAVYPRAERPERTIDTGTGLEPVRGWKRAYPVLLGGGVVLFRPTNSDHPCYGVEATAECARRFADTLIDGASTDGVIIHRAPEPQCSCGFYAYNHRPDDLYPTWDLAVLEVELYGRVIIGERGYRAEKQRVLSITALPRCQYDGPELYGRGELVSFTTSIGPLHCLSPARFRTTRGVQLCAMHAVAQPWRFEEWKPEIPVCETEWRWA